MIKHQHGATQICGQPQRIVVLGPYVLEPLLALGVQPIGYADHVAFHQGDYTDPRQQIPYLGGLITQPIANVGLAGNPSIETILKIKPDLILGSDVVSASHYDMLSKIAPTLLLDYYDPVESLRAIAQAVNRTEQAQRLLNQTQQQIEAARETFAPLAAIYPKVVSLSTSNLRDMWISRKSAGLCDSLLEELGFKLVFPPGLNRDNSSASMPLSIEILPQLNDADSFILLGHNFNDLKCLKEMERFTDHQLAKLKQKWQENKITQSLDASQAGRVYFIPAYLCAGLPGAIGTELYLEELKQQLLAPS
ncbi:MAG: iron-siderophore ABC transporter substrate-binding protein [Cyanobacteria bacterium P01_G01_bin.54]